MAEIKVLGPIEGFRDGEQVDIGGPTQRRLLASLAARPDQVVSVASLLEALWGDNPPPSGAGSIQAYISRLRRGLGSEVIETTAPGYRLKADHVALDSLVFLDIASELPHDPESRLETLESALGLWRGPPFEDFEHLEFAARRLAETRYELEEEKARLLAAGGHVAMAVGVLESVLSAEPLRESSWATLGIVLADAGRQAEAVRALNRYRSRLAELGLEPGPAFVSAESDVFETSRSPRPPVLIGAETSFIGRTTEKTELEGMLAENRLVTVVGPGGMGKTRLAMEVAASRENSEVAFVRLESLRDDREVAATVLHTLGGETRGDPTVSVIAQLSRLALPLLVLDNVEHVLDTTAALSNEILGSTSTTILVTSREPMNMPGETVFTLGPLDATSAVALFRDRARSVSPNFESTAAILDMLCEELDYMPLAIEMTAARSKALAPDEILARLDRRFGLLAGPRRSGVARHRSLDAMVEWSYDLLEPTGQRVFERLSVIAGTFDMALAGALAGFGDVPPELVTATVANLVDRSLVQRTTAGSFRMLRVLKSFGRQRLESGPDLEEASRLHARWFGDLATQIGDGLSTPEETTWIARANAALDDLGAALIWSVESADLDTAQLILEGLFDWFYHRQPPAITGWGDLVLEMSRDHEVYSVASAWTALAALKRGEVTRAGELARAGTVIDGAAGRFAWFMTGEVACYEDRLEDALDAYRKQRVRASGLGDRIGVVDAVAGETLALAFQGIFARAAESATSLDGMAADIGAPTYRAYADYALAEAILDSEPERAAELLEDAVRQAATVNNHYIQAMAKTTLGSVLSRLQRLDDATRVLHEAMELWETMGMPAYQWTIVQYLAGVLAESGEAEPAAKLLAASQRAGRRPFGAGQRHWAKVVQEIESDPSWGVWAAEGEQFGLTEAVELALTSTRQRR